MTAGILKSCNLSLSSFRRSHLFWMVSLTIFHRVQTLDSRRGDEVLCGHCDPGAEERFSSPDTDALDSSAAARLDRSAGHLSQIRRIR